MTQIKKSFQNKEILFAAAFAIYLYIYISVATLTNKNSTGFISAEAHLYIYYINQLCFVAGIILFDFLWKRSKHDKSKSRIIKISSAAFFLLSFIIILFPSAAAFLLLAPIDHILLGILGGAVNYFVSSALLETGDVGKVIAFGAAVVYLLQFIVQIIADNSLLLLAFIIAGGLALIPIVKNSRGWILLDCLPSEEAKKSSLKLSGDKKKLLIEAIILSVCACALLTYYDSWLIRAMVNSDMEAISAYSWPRLVTILGYIIIGSIGDFKHGKYVNIVFFIITLWLFILPVMLSESPYNPMIMVIFYFVVGAFNGYVYLTFFKLAPYTGRYAIIFSSMGRLIEGIIGVIFSFLPWERMFVWQISALGIMGVTVMLIAVMICDSFMLKNNEKNNDASVMDVQTGSSEPKPEDPVTISLDNSFSQNDTADAFELIAKDYNLTERELEVFKKLILTEDSGQEIADNLYISRRVFQRHVSSIYEKTGTKSRVGLYQVYHKKVMKDT